MTTKTELDISTIGYAQNIKEVVLGVDPIKLVEFMAVVRYGAKVILAKEYLERVTKSRALVERFFDENRKIYGITTGFGDNVQHIVPQSEGGLLQQNIIRSHAVSVGEALSEEGTRAQWLMQLLSLGLGYSGIRAEVLLMIAACLNKHVYPYVPSEGSIQCLPTEAYASLVLMGEGQVWCNGSLVSGSEALKLAGIKPMSPACKEVDIPIERAHPSDGGGTRFRRGRAHRDDGGPTAYLRLLLSAGGFEAFPH